MKLLKGKFGLLALGLAIGVGVMFGAPQVLGDYVPFLKKDVPAASAKPANKEGEEPRAGMMYPLKERIVNLADPGVSRYVKTSIVLELADHSGKPLPKGDEYKKKQAELVNELKAQQPVIEDKVTTVLSSKTSADLMSAEGKQRLKEELKAGLNKSFADKQEVLAVYFSDFIIQ